MCTKDPVKIHYTILVNAQFYGTLCSYLGLAKWGAAAVFPHGVMAKAVCLVQGSFEKCAALRTCGCASCARSHCTIVDYVYIVLVEYI